MADFTSRLQWAETAVVEDPRELPEATCMPDMIMLLNTFQLPRVREPPVEFRLRAVSTLMTQGTQA